MISPRILPTLRVRLCMARRGCYQLTHAYQPCNRLLIVQKVSRSVKNNISARISGVFQVLCQCQNKVGRVIKASGHSERTITVRISTKNH